MVLWIKNIPLSSSICPLSPPTTRNSVTLIVYELEGRIARLCYRMKNFKTLHRETQPRGVPEAGGSETKSSVSQKLLDIDMSIKDVLDQ